MGIRHILLCQAALAIVLGHFPGWLCDILLSREVSHTAFFLHAPMASRRVNCQLWSCFDVDPTSTESIDHTMAESVEMGHHQSRCCMCFNNTQKICILTVYACGCSFASLLESVVWAQDGHISIANVSVSGIFHDSVHLHLALIVGRLGW